MRRKIFWGALIVGVVTLTVGIATALLLRRTLQEQQQQELFRQAEVTARIIDEELSSLRVAGRGPRLVAQNVLRARQVLERARVVGGHDVVEAAVVSDDNLVTLGVDPKLLPQIPEGVTEREVLTVDVAGTPIIATVRRLELPSGLQVIVAIGRVENLLPVAAVTRSLLIALAIGAVLIVGFGLWFTRVTGKRLRGLEQASRAIAGGDLGARAQVEGNDEITAVSLAFNDMATRLEGAQRRERDFLMSVGHDLRTPLTTIRGYAEALDAGDVGADDLDRVGGVLHVQTDRLTRLIEDLMLLARLEAREFTLRPEAVDLTAVVKEIVEGYQERADAAFVRLELDVDEVDEVMIDPDRLGQVAGNLLDNALRYAPQGGVVFVRLRPEGENVTLVVADSGPGIDAADLPHVFERLYVAQRYRPVRPEGSGLGLSIVRELVEAMDGTVTVDSIVGEGTTVTVRLPS